MTWGDYLTFEYGKPVPDKNAIDGSVPVYGTNGQIGTSHLPALCKIPSFIVGRKGAYRGVHYSAVPFSVIDTAFYALPTTNKVDLKWAYYKFLTYDINRMDSGSAIPSTDRYELYRIPVEIPELRTQKKTVEILDSLENKITLNRELNKNLEQQADALYQAFFSPKSGTQGKTVILDEYCSIFTGKKNANASVFGGRYKFFTCAPDALQIDSYIFDGNAIIVSGNGAYTGRTRFYSGKFDLYQRTYACTLLDGLNPDFIFPQYWFVKLELSKKIMGGTRGSAIPYIVMNDLAKFSFIYNENTFATYLPVFKSLTETIQSNEFEIETLTSIRDNLLPRLVSGELDLSDIDL